MLACRFCTLDLHGRPLLGERTHTKLAQTAAKGSRELRLAEPVDWDVGADVALTSTSADGTMDEAETVTISAVLDGGYRLLIEQPLEWEHLGETMQFAGGHTAEFRADVALLSRNVVVQGSQSSILDKHGAHIMLHSRRHASIVDRSQGESLVARIENIEVRYAGQMGRIGRYSIHFHMCATARHSNTSGCPPRRGCFKV